MTDIETALIVATPAGGTTLIIPPGCRADAPEYICDEVASGRSLVEVCEDDGLPASKIVRRWLRQDAEFRQQYLDAYKIYLTLEIPNILEIADDGDEEVKRDTLRINTRVKLLEKLAPDQFGNKVEVTVNPMGEMLAFIAARGSQPGEE